MNWLAHLYLSGLDPRFRVGNVLPDLASARQLSGLPEPYQLGIRCHRQIDIFTDAHPRVKRCVARFPKPFRRYGGILTDVYFDYFLARDWGRYSAVPLRGFIDEFYRDLDICLPEIPAEGARAFHRMREQDWLGSYRELSGIVDILKRISGRLRRPFDLSGSVTFFAEHESAFQDDFQAFFPELMTHAGRDCARLTPRYAS